MRNARLSRLTNHCPKFVLALSLACLALMVNPAVLRAQSNISGDIAGTVTDPTGAAVPGAKVVVTGSTTGTVKTAMTGGTGDFRVPLLSPGMYKIEVTATGFETSTSTSTVSAGTISQVNVGLTLGQQSTTVQVSAAAPLLHTEDAQISTTFSLSQIQNLPNPGNDLTFVAQTTPGAIMNTQGGYGNFEVNGLPGTSNTFTINGGYEGDPYLNLNNSGATNLLLGNNDVETVTVTTNAYDSAFGGLGGAQVNEVSRSGGNAFHGNASYWWNGSALNANSYFNNQYGSPKGFDNANQWAAAIGGPIKRDKAFFFVDTEGFRVIIPVRGTAYGPSPAYQAAILAPAGGGGEGTADRFSAARSGGRHRLGNASATPAAESVYTPYGNLADNGLSAEAPLYQSIFNYYNNAPNFASGSQDPNDPDTWIFNGQSTNFGREWLVTGRVDYNLSPNDEFFVHFKVDQGVQPTATSFLNPIFDAESPQPSYEGQLSETHTFSPSLTNQFLFAASYYRAIFTNTSASALASTIPFVLIPEGFASGGDWDIAGNQSEWVGNIDYALPQGRNVTGYQFNDDLSRNWGKHTSKFGFTMRRDDVTDYTSSEHNINFAGGENIILDQGDFAAGYSDDWSERIPLRLSNPVAFYVMGAYGQDQWKVMPNFTLTAGLRLEHNSNPKCLTNCVSNFSENFGSLSTDTSTAYNALISTNRKRAFFKQQDVAFEPRIGFAYQPGGTESKTTFRGGFGMFADYFPAQIMGDLLANPPTVNRWTVLGAAYVGAGGFATPLDPNQPSSGHALSVISNSLFDASFPTGGSYDSLSDASGGVFRRPSFTAAAHKIHLPTYEEFSLSMEHEFTKSAVLSLTYVGNHGYHEPVANMPNAWDPYGDNATLPQSRVNGSFAAVTDYYSGASSNFNGVIASLTSRRKWLSLQFNYAYGHALDEVSNGGFDAFGVNGNGQINPYNLSQNYGNADYDVRHYISANYVIDVPYWGGPHVLTDHWQWSGTVFHNTGYPFSVGDDTGDILYGNSALAKQTDNDFNHHCGGGSHTLVPCDFASHFTSSSDYGQQRRNQLFGPAYSDFDMGFNKGFSIPHWESAQLKVGVQMYNTFNHTNFQIPNNDVNDGPANGLIYTTANTPTSILGAFLGGDASPRLIQFKGTFSF
jgi:hypothetical protein